MKHNVILTGISRGLGLCLFEQLIKRDDLRIIAIGRHFTDAVKAQAYACIAWDFNHPETIPQLTEFLPQDGSLTLINNAGVVLPIGAVGSLDEQAMVQAANVNFISPMLLVNELNKLRRHRPPGSDTLTIVNLSTGAANTPIAGWGAYCSTKAAIKMFFDVLAGENEQHVRVIHFDPGVMDTDMQKRIREADFPRHEEFVGYKETGRLRRPVDVATEIMQKYFKIH